MKLKEKKALREKSTADLQNQAEGMRKEFAVAKMQFKVGKLPNVKLLSNLRRKIALTETIVQEKAKAEK